jgi:hypothetical protein
VKCSTGPFELQLFGADGSHRAVVLDFPDSQYEVCLTVIFGGLETGLSVLEDELARVPVRTLW